MDVMLFAVPLVVIILPGANSFSCWISRLRRGFLMRFRLRQEPRVRLGAPCVWRDDRYQVRLAAGSLEMPWKELIRSRFGFQVLSCHSIEQLKMLFDQGEIMRAGAIKTRDAMSVRRLSLIGRGGR